MKLKDKVGMGGPKSTQTRFVGIIMSIYILLRLLFSISCHMPVHCDSLVLSLPIHNNYYPLAISMAGKGGGITLLPGYFIPAPILKSKRRDVYWT